MNEHHQPFEEIRHYGTEGQEFWSARELAPLLDYRDWRNFQKVLARATQACEASNQAASDHFVETTKMVVLGSGAQRELEDVHLSRYACYLVVQNGDLFVSIHADAFTSRQPSGSSVFALSTKGATSTAAKYLAQTQNASDLIGGVSKSGDRYVDHTMFDMVQSLTIADSLKFGKAVLNKLGKINKLHKNQVEQAGFAVLKAPDIPSILVETAFISNVEEERKLKTATFQQEVAESILAGIKAYFADGATLARRG